MILFSAHEDCAMLAAGESTMENKACGIHSCRAEGAKPIQDAGDLQKPIFSQAWCTCGPATKNLQGRVSENQQRHIQASPVPLLKHFGTDGFESPFRHTGGWAALYKTTKYNHSTLQRTLPAAQSTALLRGPEKMPTAQV